MASPEVSFIRAESVFDYVPEDFSLIGYNPYGPIKGAVAV